MCSADWLTYTASVYLFRELETHSAWSHIDTRNMFNISSSYNMYAFAHMTRFLEQDTKWELYDE